MKLSRIVVVVLMLLLMACSAATPPVPTPVPPTSTGFATQTAVPNVVPTLAVPTTWMPSSAQTSTTAPTATPVPLVNLSGTVFFDYNGNGIRDDKEPVIPNAKLKVGDFETTSGANGSYSLSNVPQGKREITISAEGFHFVALSLAAFQSLDKSIALTLDRNSKRDWGLMVGFLTSPFKCEDIGKLGSITYIDLDYKLGSIRTYARTCPYNLGGSGKPMESLCTRDNHAGIDWHGPEGVPLLAGAPGTVAFVGERPDGVNGGGGIFVRLIHDGLGRKFMTDYIHNQKNLVVPGQKVERGQVIALLGKTGSDVPHLHSGLLEIPISLLTISQWNSYISDGVAYPKMVDPFHQYTVSAGLDPYRDLSNPASESLWTKDNDPQCIQSSAMSEIPNWGQPNALINLTDSAINADGNPNDWGTRMPNRTPPPGNVTARAAGAEISAAYGFADSKNLYLRLDQFGGFPQPPLKSFDYSFEVTSPEWGNRWYLITIPNTGSLLRLVPVEEATFFTEEQKIYNAVAIGQVLEAIVPLEMLNHPSQIAITPAVYSISGTNPFSIQLKR